MSRLALIGVGIYFIGDGIDGRSVGSVVKIVAGIIVILAAFGIDL